MEAREQPTEGIGTLLEALRREKGFTKLSLADASGVSATYVAMIEGGLDSRTGKEIRPSPDTLRKLAEALGRGGPGEAGRLYTRMMGVLGYLPEGESAGAGTDSGAEAVVLRDPRLHGHVRAVLEAWEQIPEDEQTALLTLFKLIDQKRRRR